MKNISLYIHIPFCVRKCQYCDFLSFSEYPPAQQEAYINQLGKEIECYREIAKDYRVGSVFIGGGTPSILKEGLVEQLFHKLYSVWQLEDGDRKSVV